MYAPQLGKFISRDPEGYFGGRNLYQYGFSNPNGYVDPLGLQNAPTTQPSNPPTSQPVAGPTVGPVKTTTGPGTRYQLFYRGPRAEFYQTIQISALPCCKIPPAARLMETKQHGGHDPTTQPVADNPTGDPSKQFGGAIIPSPGGATMVDSPNFDDPAYPAGFQGQKRGQIIVVCHGKVVAAFDFVTTATARGPGHTVLSPSTQPVAVPTAPVTQPTTEP